MPDTRLNLAMFRLLSVICLLLLGAVAYSQSTGVVYGRITDENGEPLPGVNIYLLEQPGSGTISSQLGNYRLTVPAGKKVRIVFSSLGYKNDTLQVMLQGGEEQKLDIQFSERQYQLPAVDIQQEKEREEASTVKIEVDAVRVNPDPSGNIEALLTSQALGVSKNNELSSGYSVRGGNYDENLVYVNDFEIYRPFLIRSGQQEGLSFVNPDMVSSISFSSGGFQPKYGDKMSSVLDVSYRKPQKFEGSVSGGLLGGSLHLGGASKAKRFTFLSGLRYKSSTYLLKGLETKGEYNPSFIDFQAYITYKLSEKTSLEYITNFSRNRFHFEPVESETTFGVVNNVLRLTVYFEGQEDDRYQTYMNGFALVNNVNDRLKLKWLLSAYRTRESEAFDILGEYWLDEVESDFGKENFGQTRYSLGAGGIQRFTRNEMEATILSGGHRGYFDAGVHYLQWGLNYKYESIQDKINEWERLDSAGYSLPYSDEAVLLADVLKTRVKLRANRYEGFIQDNWMINDNPAISLNYGVRFHYWDVNREFLVSPRAQVSWKPLLKRDIVFTAAAGFYHQPPFYRELRDLNGVVHRDVRAQKSYHAVLGMDWHFKAWGRDFKFVSEVYYKHFKDLIPYEFDNVLIRYFGENNAKGYAAGIDMRLHGEFVSDAESWITLSIMQTREDILDDVAVVYKDADGNVIHPNSADADKITDTVITHPGFVPRPTDQRVSFSLFFQDYLPKNKNFKMHLNLVFGSGLPFGPPDSERYQDTLRIPFYRRVDIGFSALLWDAQRRKNKERKSFMNHIHSIWATLEVFNLLGVANTVSYYWVKDIRNTVYAVPNHLTSRRINGRVVVKF